MRTYSGKMQVKNLLSHIPPGRSSLYQIWYKPGKKGDTGGLYCGLSRPDFASVEIVLVLTRYCSFLDFLSESNSV